MEVQFPNAYPATTAPPCARGTPSAPVQLTTSDYFTKCYIGGDFARPAASERVMRMGRKMSLKSLQGKRAVITGAGSGLGRELALLLAGRGFRVGLADIDPKGGEAYPEPGGGHGRLRRDVRLRRQRTRADAGGGRLFLSSLGRRGPADLQRGRGGGWHDGRHPSGGLALADGREFLGEPSMPATPSSPHARPRVRLHHQHRIRRRDGLPARDVILQRQQSGGDSAVREYQVGTGAARRRGDRSLSLLFQFPFGDNLRYTDPYQLEFCEAAFGCAALDARQVAGQVLAAADRGRMYLHPHFTVNTLLWLKRLSPALFVRRCPGCTSEG